MNVKTALQPIERVGRGGGAQIELYIYRRGLPTNTLYKRIINNALCPSRSVLSVERGTGRVEHTFGARWTSGRTLPLSPSSVRSDREKLKFFERKRDCVRVSRPSSCGASVRGAPKTRAVHATLIIRTVYRVHGYAPVSPLSPCAAYEYKSIRM